MKRHSNSRENFTNLVLERDVPFQLLVTTRGENAVWISQIGRVEEAENFFLQQVQLVYFNPEVQALKRGSPVISSSSLRSLNLFLDYEGILRVGGWLANSKLKFSRNHLIILLKKSRYTRLLVFQLHQTHLHTGPTTMEPQISGSIS